MPVAKKTPAKTSATKKTPSKKTSSPRTTSKKNVKTTSTKKEDIALDPSIDSRQRFYNSISQELKQEMPKTAQRSGETFSPDEEASDGSVKSIRLYRSIAFKFIIFAAILVLIVFYFSVVKLTVVIHPTQEMISDSLIFDVYDKDLALKQNIRSVQGVVKSVPVEEERIYSSSGEELVGEEVIGQVEIINNYSSSQPLVATTRLLSPDNKLFRIAETVNVPAKGSVVVGIYADKPGPEMAIRPTKFIIPGLWAGLQDKIYAESKDEFVYQNKIRYYVRQLDIDRALQDLNEALLNEVKNQFGTNYEGYDQVIYTIDNDALEINLDAKLKDEVEQFKASSKNRVTLAAFSNQEIINMAQEKLELIVPDDKKLVGFDDGSIVYSIENYDIENGIATVKASFSGKMSLREESEIVDRNKIINLNKSQLEEYLDSFKEIASYEIKFSPAFIKHTPRLTDRITLKIVD